MAKWVNLLEGAVYLETTRSCIVVTAFDYKKKCGEYPCWYKSDGIPGRKSLVDIDYLLSLRKKEMEEYYASCDLFYFITEDMDIKQWKLCDILSEQSETFKDKRSWNSFMQSYLFSEPVKKFNDSNSLRKEFYRICIKIKEDYECKKKFTES